MRKNNFIDSQRENLVVSDYTIALQTILLDIDYSDL